MDSRPLSPTPAPGVAKEMQEFHRNRNPFTLKVVADSGLARTKGEMRTMPAKWHGLSAAVRMAMAPPCKAKWAELLCAGARQHVIPSELRGRGPLSLAESPGDSPGNRRHPMLDKLGLQLFYYAFLPRSKHFREKQIRFLRVGCKFNNTSLLCLRPKAGRDPMDPFSQAYQRLFLFNLMIIRGCYTAPSLSLPSPPRPSVQ